jgi:hypothetical protein
VGRVSRGGGSGGYPAVMLFPVELHGGPFDGDRGHYGGPELPPALWVWVDLACPRCPDPVHWQNDPLRAGRGAEKYIYDRIRDGAESVAIYVYADLDYDGILRDEREVIHA